MARIQLTPEQLQSAWQRLRVRHPGWPLTLAECMGDALRAALIRGEAVRQVLRDCAKPPRWAAPLARQPDLDTARRRAHPAAKPGTPPPLDRKRIAAGDRDDD